MIRQFDFLYSPLLDGEGDGSSGGTDNSNDGSPGGVSGEAGGETSGNSFIGEHEGTIDFPEGLEDEIKNDPSLKVFIKDNKINYANMMKSYVHAQKQMGRDKVTIPGKNSTEEEWNDFYNKMGRPDLADYKVNVEGMDEDDKEIIEVFKTEAHKIGLLPSQAEKMLAWFQETSNQIGENAQKAIDEKYNQELSALKKEWGDAYDRETKLAEKAFKEFADENDIKALKAQGLLDNLALVKLFNKIGKDLLTEDKFDKESHGSFGMTQREAETKINDMMSNANGPYLNSDHPNHKIAVEEMLKLQSVLYPN